MPSNRPPQTDKSFLLLFFKKEVFLPYLALLLAPPLIHLPELLGWIDCSNAAHFAGMLTTAPHRLLEGGCFIDGNAGGTLQALGHLSAQQWLSFQLPWWNPYNGAGLPLAAEMQPASFFLPFILLLHFAQGLLVIKIAMQILAGLAMFACLRGFGAGPGGALAGGLIYAFCGTFAWFGDAPMLPIAFLPLVVLGIERCRAAAVARRPGGVPLVALGLAFSLLAGFPETAFVNDLLAGLWALLVLAAPGGPARARLAAKLLSAAALALLLAAPAVLPFLDDLRHADLAARALVQPDHLGAGQGAVLLLPTLFGPPYYHVLTFGAWGGSGGYLGLGAVFAGLAAAVSLRAHRRFVVLALVWTAFLLAIFFGEPVARAVWQATPLLSQVAVTRYAMPSLSFVWAVLAGLAWDGWSRGQLRVGWAAMAAAAAVAACLAAGLANHRIFAAGWHPDPYAALTTIWAAILLTGLVVLWRRPATAWRQAAAALLLAIDVGAAFALPIATGTLDAQQDLAPIKFLAAQPGFTRSFGFDSRLLPNYGAYFEVPTLQSFSQPVPLEWAAYARRLGANVGSDTIFFDPKQMTAEFIAHRTLFEQSGVEFVTVDARDDPLAPTHDPSLKIAFEDPATRIYRLPNPAPYFQVLHGTCTLHPQSRTDLDATCDTSATLLRREYYYPGWHATVNGHKHGAERAAEVFQSVDLPAGHSSIHWYYAPNYANAIALLFALGVLGFVKAATRKS